MPPILVILWLGHLLFRTHRPSGRKATSTLTETLLIVVLTVPVVFTLTVIVLYTGFVLVWNNLLYPLIT